MQRAPKDAGDVLQLHRDDPEVAKQIVGALIASSQPMVEPFPVRTYSGLPDAPVWLFHGLIEAGTCSVLAAEPKAGKSWFVFDMGIALATGERLLGEWAPVERGPTLFYSPEGGDRSRHARIVGLCWGRGLDPGQVLPSLPFVDARLDLAASGHAERLARTIDVTGARLVVVDPLVSAHLGIDENNAGEVMSILNPLRDMIAARPQCSLIVVHHTHKGAKDKALSLGLRGSSALAGWMDSCVFVRRADDDSGGPRRIDIAHRDAAAPEPLGFQLAHGPDEEHPGHSWFRLERCEAPELGAGGGATGGHSGPRLDNRLLDSIVDLVKKHPGELTRGAGATRLGLNDRRLFNRHVDRLVQEGVLELVHNSKMRISS